MKYPDNWPHDAKVENVHHNETTTPPQSNLKNSVGTYAIMLLVMVVIILPDWRALVYPDEMAHYNELLTECNKENKHREGKLTNIPTVAEWCENKHQDVLPGTWVYIAGFFILMFIFSTFITGGQAAFLGGMFILHKLTS